MGKRLTVVAPVTVTVKSQELRVTSHKYESQSESEYERHHHHHDDNYYSTTPATTATTTTLDSSYFFSHLSHYTDTVESESGSKNHRVMHLHGHGP